MMSHIEMEYAKTLKQVSQLERKLAEAVAAERERCARVCEERGSFNSMYAHHILTGAAAAIRKGEKESLTVAERKPVPEFELIEKWEGE
jgi:hypothetical protein